MKNIVLLVPLYVIFAVFSVEILWGSQRMSNLKLFNKTQEKTLMQIVHSSECIRIDVDNSDASWDKFISFFSLASLHGKEVILQSGIRALSLTSTRAWRKEVNYRIVGSDKNFTNHDQQKINLILCQFDQNGSGFIGDKKTPVERYFKDNPNKQIVLICTFEKGAKLKSNFDILHRITQHSNLLDFTFIQN